MRWFFIFLWETESDKRGLYLSLVQQEPYRNVWMCWSNTAHQHTEPHWFFIFTHSDQPVHELHSAHMELLVEILPNVQLYFPGCLTRTGTKSCFFFVVCWVKVSVHQSDTEWVRGFERTEQGLWNTESVQTLFSWLYVSLMSHFWRTCSTCPVECDFIINELVAGQELASACGSNILTVWTPHLIPSKKSEASLKITDQAFADRCCTAAGRLAGLHRKPFYGMAGSWGQTAAKTQLRQIVPVQKQTPASASTGHAAVRSPCELYQNRITHWNRERHWLTWTQLV